MKWFIAALAALLPVCAQENLNSVLWMQTSVEYRANAIQSYRAAEMALERALATPNWTAALEQTGDFSAKPPAVILDLDETVLDNSAYQARLVKTGQKFDPKTWAAWVSESKAGLVPGAAEFLSAAAFHGVRRVYLTNRVCDPSKKDDPTVAVLVSHGLLLRTDTLLCKASDTDSSDKSARRYMAAAGHRILLLVGDDIHDFFSAPLTAEARNANLQRYARWFGDRWFLIPNPSYGSWERLFSSEQAKKDALQTAGK